jgi:hypothetical protein
VHPWYRLDELRRGVAVGIVGASCSIATYTLADSSSISLSMKRGCFDAPQQCALQAIQFL